jgi:hypothetical protein
VLNAFQIQLIDQGRGNFDIIYRYEATPWVDGDQTKGTYPSIGYDAGDGVNAYNHPISRTAAIKQTAYDNGLPALSGTMDAGSIEGPWQAKGVIKLSSDGLGAGSINAPSHVVRTSGEITFSDANVSDNHAVSVAPIGTPSGALTATLVSDTTAGTGGRVRWDYALQSDAVVFNPATGLNQQYENPRTILAPGQTKVESFLVTITDTSGGVVTQRVDVTVRGTIYGTNAADSLSGTTGDDYILGRDGADVILGLAGADRFLYGEKTDSDLVATDTIQDFLAGTDRIDFAGTLGLTAIAGNLGTATTLAADSVGWTTAGGITTVYANLGSATELLASGPNMMKIVLANGASLTSASFNLNA